MWVFLPGLGRVAISCCSMVTSTKLGLFEVTWRMYGGSVAIVVILAIEVGNLLLGIDKKTVTKKKEISIFFFKNSQNKSLFFPF